MQSFDSLNEDWLQNRTNTILCEVLDGGKLPTKAHASDAGFDLYATEDLEIKSGQITKTLLNIRLQLPKGTYAEITSKSGLGVKGLLVFAGIIDENYRGIPSVVCTNLTYESDIFYGKDILIPGEPIMIKMGQKIGQMILHKFETSYEIVQVSKVSVDTDRGCGGFSSSGL